MGKFFTIATVFVAAFASAQAKKEAAPPEKKVTLTMQGYGPRMKSIPFSGTQQIYTAYLSSEEPVGDERLLLDSGQTVEIELKMTKGSVAIAGGVTAKDIGGGDIIGGLEEGYNNNCKNYWRPIKEARDNKDGTWNVCSVFQPFLEKLKAVSGKVGKLKADDRFVFHFGPTNMKITFQGAGDVAVQELASIDNQPGLPFSRFMPLNWIGVPLKGNALLKKQMLNADRWGKGDKKAEADSADGAVIAIDPAHGTGSDIN